jgi:hypothetical protein
MSIRWTATTKTKHGLPPGPWLLVAAKEGGLGEANLTLTRFMGYLHKPTDISENYIVQHLKMSYGKNRIDPICENCVVRHNLSDCVNRPEVIQDGVHTLISGGVINLERLCHFRDSSTSMGHFNF